MVSKLAEKFVNWQIQNSSIKNADAELYRYGYELVFSLLFNLGIAAVIAAAFSAYYEVLIFYTAYSGLRVFAGGYHARDHEKCMIMSGTIVILVCVVVGKVPQAMYLPCTMLHMLIAVPLIWKIVPVEDCNKPLDDKETAVYRKKARMILCMECAAALFCGLFGWRRSGYLISLSCFLLCVTLLMGFVKNKRIARQMLGAG